MITRQEMELFAERWVAASAPPGVSPAVHEFDLGYVVQGRQQPRGSPLLFVIDRETGELSVWPSLRVKKVIRQFLLWRAERSPATRTWDPAAQARRDLRRVATPANVTYLIWTDRLLVALSVKGDQEPAYHRLVREFLFGELSPQYRERGYDRCSEVAVLSDALHAEDARRSAAREPLITLEQARTGLFGGAGMVTYRVREYGDPVAEQSGPPCISCALLGRHFGFQLSPPASLGFTDASGSGEEG